MSVELRMLVWAVVLGLVQIAIAATLTTSQRGFAWGVGARDDTSGTLTPLAGRCVRASANFLETFPLFAVALIAVVLAGKTGDQSRFGAWLYVIARVAYTPVYALGLPIVRTVIWAFSMIGILMVILAYFL